VLELQVMQSEGQLYTYRSAPTGSKQQCMLYSHLLKPLDLHVVGIYSGVSLSVEHSTSFTDGHGLVVLHSKHVVEIWHGGQVTAGPTVVAYELLCELAVLWQCIGSPRVCLHEAMTQT